MYNSISKYINRNIITRESAYKIKTTTEPDLNLKLFLKPEIDYSNSENSRAVLVNILLNFESLKNS